MITNILKCSRVDKQRLKWGVFAGRLLGELEWDKAEKEPLVGVKVE